MEKKEESVLIQRVQLSFLSVCITNLHKLHTYLCGKDTGANTQHYKVNILNSCSVICWRLCEFWVLNRKERRGLGGGGGGETDRQSYKHPAL